MSEPRAGWSAVDLGPIGRIDCPPGWVAETPAQGAMPATVAAPDGAARLVAHAVVHRALADGADIESRMHAAAARVLRHLGDRPGTQTPEVLSISGAAQPMLEVACVFFDHAERPRARIRQWHVLAPLDGEARRIAIIAFSLMTPALAPVENSADLADGFKDGLYAAAAAISDGEIFGGSP